jgi:translocation and assembly module TamB
MLVPLVAGIGALVAANWLLHTESGARWVWAKAIQSVPGSLSAEGMSGDLSSGFSLSQLRFENESVRVEIAKLKLQINVDLLPPALRIESLLSEQAVVSMTSDTESGPDPHSRFRPESLSLPLPVYFEQVELTHFQYLNTDNDLNIESPAVSLSGSWHERIHIDQLEIQLEEADIMLTGGMEFSEPYPLGFTAETNLRLIRPDTNTISSHMLKAGLSGNLEELDVQLTIDQPAISIQGKLNDLLTEARLDLELSAISAQWPVLDEVPQITITELTAHIIGSAQDFDLKASGQLDLGDITDLSLSMNSKGNTQGMQIEQLDLHSDVLQLTAHGPLRWADGLSANLSSQLERLHPGKWIEGWPSEQHISGRFDLVLEENHIQIPLLRLLAGDGGFELEGSGEFDPEQGVVAADLQWSDLRWPLGSELAEFTSETGTVVVLGKPEDWLITGQLDLQAGTWPATVLVLNGGGDLESAQLQIDNGEVLGGQFTGRLNYQWSGSQNWSASLSAQELDISTISDTYSGVISTEASARGKLESGSLEVDIQRLDGEINGTAIRADGLIALENDLIHARNLQIHSGSSHLTLDGNLQDDGGLKFSTHIESLASFIPGLEGTISGNGLLSTDSENPQFQIELEGGKFIFGDTELTSISSRVVEEMDGKKSVHIELDELVFGDQKIEKITLTSGGEKPFEHIRLIAQRGDNKLESVLKGVLLNWENPIDAGWAGNIESFVLSRNELRQLGLVQPASLAFDSDSIQLDPMCLTGNHAESLCADYQWKIGKHLAAKASLQAISFAMIQPFLTSEFEFTQTVSGEIAWQQSVGNKPNAQIQIETSAGQISTLGEDTVIGTGPGIFGFQISNGQLLAGNLDISLDDIGVLDTDFSAPDISLGIDSEIEGHIKIDFDRIQPLVSLIPQIDNASGAFKADIRLSGKFSQPDLSGNATLQGGRIEHVATGMVISDIQLDGAISKLEQLDLQGSFTAGEGSGQITAQVDFNKPLEPAGSLHLSGENLTLINTPDLNIEASPDVHLDWQNNVLNLDGNILIPRARISPVHLPGSDATESEDLVIVAGQSDRPDSSANAGSKLSLNGQLALELGQEVEVILQRAKANLSGKTTFIWDKDLLPKADGRYTLSGKISAYGQVLDISEGRINFPMVSANNPHLNISAERTIFGNLQIRTAGVLVTGTLQNPDLMAFTVPATTEERALTLLITGYEFDFEQGVGGVQVGMYIAPRLFVSYGFGLFDSENVVSARYDLRRGFGIKATSGERETGVDISYTVER